jgi:hypothetical protein
MKRVIVWGGKEDEKMEHRSKFPNRDGIILPEQVVETPRRGVFLKQPSNYWVGEGGYEDAFET